MINVYTTPQQGWAFFEDEQAARKSKGVHYTEISDDWGYLADQGHQGYASISAWMREAMAGNQEPKLPCIGWATFYGTVLHDTDMDMLKATNRLVHDITSVEAIQRFVLAKVVDHVEEHNRAFRETILRAYLYGRVPGSKAVTEDEIDAFANGDSGRYRMDRADFLYDLINRDDMPLRYRFWSLVATATYFTPGWTVRDIALMLERRLNYVLWGNNDGN